MQGTASRDYFERRAEEERIAAEQANDTRAAQSHRDLAEHYRKLAVGPEQPVAHQPEIEGGILPREFRIVP